MSVSDLLHAADGDVAQTGFQTPVLAERVATATTRWLRNPTTDAYVAMVEAVTAWESHHTTGAAAAQTVR